MNINVSWRVNFSSFHVELPQPKMLYWRLILLVSAVICSEQQAKDSSEDGVAPGPKSTTCECGKANRDDGRIINGKVTNEGKYPFMVSLRDTDEGIHFCGGSILSPNHILTAAHCVSKEHYKTQPKPHTLKVVVGTNSIYTYEPNPSHGQTQELKVKKVSIPKEWFAVKESLAGDIAVLHLETPIKFSKWVSPVCLTPNEPPVVDKFVKVIGWGQTEDADYSGYLREANVPVLESALCHNNLQETCFKNANSSACMGDSGGPYLYVDPETNRYTQIALVSYSYGLHCDRRPYVVGTNVVYWYDWIKNAMAESSTDSICRKAE